MTKSAPVQAQKIYKKNQKVNKKTKKYDYILTINI